MKIKKNFLKNLSLISSVMLRKLRLRQKKGFLIKNVYLTDKISNVFNSDLITGMMLIELQKAFDIIQIIILFYCKSCLCLGFQIK